jgi:exonuclease SbcC
MIPVTLRLRNFLCYGEDVEPLDFTGLHLACLSGENGHGKSALLDAITWALWGKARASTDELIRIGATEMEVDFAFELEGQRYRVVRKRDRRSRGQSTLELQAEIDGAAHSMTEPNLRATQARIIELLHLDYDTFINSAFLLQGRADEFTTRTPMDRKQILADILGLAIYDEYETRAKEQVRLQDAEARALTAQIEQWDRELAQRPTYEKELGLAEERAGVAAERVHLLDSQAQALRRELQDLQGKSAQIADLHSRIARLQDDLTRLDKQIAASQAQVADCEAILCDRDRIESGHTALLDARRRQEQFGLQLQSTLQLSQRKAELERALETERQKCLLEQRRLADRAAELERKAGDGERRASELRSLDDSVRHLLETQARRDVAREQLVHLGEQTAALRAREEQLTSNAAVVDEKRALLSSSTTEARCPLCGGGLSPQDQHRLLSDMEQQQAELRRAAQALREELDAFCNRAQGLRAEIASIDKQLVNLPGLQSRRAKLEASLEDAQGAATELAALQPQLNEAARRLERADFGHEVRTRLMEAEQEWLRVGYDAAAHQANRAELARLAPFESDKARLVAAEANLRREREHAAELARLSERTREDLTAAQGQAVALGDCLQRYDACLDELSGAERELRQAQEEETRAGRILGAARQKLDACRVIETARQTKVVARTAALGERTLFEELRVAFSKRGLQAMIIEHVLPEIEDEANAILFRMTDGPMRVKLDTQRETRDQNVVETLDISVSDEWGTRAYELFSGGEAFRINFALRVALSKLLARRAGASLQTLVIDEGFGTQDAQGRERLIEAINSIQNDFEKVLVITHIEELKEAFPTHIEVFRTPAGSQIRIT